MAWQPAEKLKSTRLGLFGSGAGWEKLISIKYRLSSTGVMKTKASSWKSRSCRAAWQTGKPMNRQLRMLSRSSRSGSRRLGNLVGRSLSREGD